MSNISWDNEQAEAEGWSLFNIKPDGTGELQRLDDVEAFPSDEAALHFVTLMAEKGSFYHQKALRLAEATTLREPPKQAYLVYEYNESWAVRDRPAFIVDELAPEEAEQLERWLNEEAARSRQFFGTAPDPDKKFKVKVITSYGSFASIKATHAVLIRQFQGMDSSSRAAATVTRRMLAGH